MIAMKQTQERDHVSLIRVNPAGTSPMHRDPSQGEGKDVASLLGQA